MMFDTDIENNFINELELFFKTIDKSNFYQKEKYDRIIEIIHRNHEKIKNADKTIEIYSSVNTDNFSEWQEDIYIDIQERLTGFSSYMNKIDLH